MALAKATINNTPVLVDDSAPTVPITDVAGDGGDIIAGIAAILARLGVAVTRTTDPTVNDDANDGLSVNATWLNTTTGDLFALRDATAGAAVWVKIGPTPAPTTPTLDSVTTAGAATANNVSVGNLTAARLITGVNNTVTGNRSSAIGGHDNTVAGTDNVLVISAYSSSDTEKCFLVNCTDTTVTTNGGWAFLVNGNEAYVDGASFCGIAPAVGSVSADYCTQIGGTGASFNADQSVIIGGVYAVSHVPGEIVTGPGQYQSQAPASSGFKKLSRAWQHVVAVTTDATPTIMLVDFGHPFGATQRLTIPSGYAIAAEIEVFAVQTTAGANVARYKRLAIFKNVSGTTTLVHSETIGADHETDATWGGIAVTADNTNDCIQIEVTGKAATTIRWMALLQVARMQFT